MTITLMQLPFEAKSLQPYISDTTISFHHGKHHSAYVNKTNELITGKQEFTNASLEEVIISSFTKLQSEDNPQYNNLFNNSAQVWNHNFYWNSLKSGGEKAIEDMHIRYPDTFQAIKRDFGDVVKLNEALIKSGMAQFGSGWTWLVYVKDKKKLQIINTPNAHTMLVRKDVVALLVIDVWEHAYYLDKQNKRAEYITNVVEHLINWKFVDENLSSSL